MTVLVIIGLVSSAVVLSFPDPKPVVDSASEKLVRDLNAAANQSVITGEARALGVSDTAYGIYVYEGDAWDIKSQTLWPDAVDVTFVKDGADIVLSETLVPLVTFDPIGGSSVFTLTLSDTMHSWALSSGGDGRVTRALRP